MTIFWFRRDLRWTDNVGLYHALQENQSVFPIFIFDHNILQQLEKNDARVDFIHDSLQKMNDEFQKYNSSIATFYGDPIEIWKELITNHNITSVYINKDYEPAARERDKKIYYLLQEHQIPLKAYKDQVIFEKNEIVKEDGSPYVVFTPYSKKWKQKFDKNLINVAYSEDYLQHLQPHSYPFLSLEKIGFKKSLQKVLPIAIGHELVDNYELNRNFPHLAKTSNAAPHLRFGTISIREIIRNIIDIENETYLNELIWREFFMNVIWHYPHTTHLCFRPKYENIPWDNNEMYFEKWCLGQTGYPIVDAGMRELNATGYLHNRVRMIVASFLCKHLLIDWRWGEAYFASKLLDYEQSSNVGNWQWAAGCGVDAAPYFRIFNPMEQTKKFDANCKYIQKWVPEYQELNYPKPIVNHQEARAKCLKVFKEALL
ncbi:deoxyribodipyrimidine photo-lyase [Flavobacterium branchiophilum]|uniref:Deoxyribodipyrimidine photolyase PhrB1 n=1 Tax=Flavobacterium branchiophilum (strain FL-15) TaxID=1034807 RepID=G2Z1C6_FLABF|nr:deoxyribodipyrimidine photo-lyase [Flavobacterium branchiophilum]CCB69691.1 Deoxyribodipyrimidine photolyase PhrB1 [Flavobacterium branchiophilum FL-15]